MQPFPTLEKRLAYFLGQTPRVDPSAFVHPKAVLLGNVTLAAHANIWPCAVLRGDINSISVGVGSNLQDGAIVHVSNEYSVVIGDWVTVGHRALVHACTVEEGCLIGMGATIMDGAVIGAESIVGAHALVTQGMQVPPGSLVLGSPAKVMRPLTESEKKEGRRLAEKYQEVAEAHRLLLQTKPTEQAA